ncbi:hypothetical protein OAS39_05790, partial [Pirellulales bacterium]|nr:hypothetical protein [Pirellulales bacterium]
MKRLNSIFLAGFVFSCLATRSLAVTVDLGADADVDIRSADQADNGYDRNVNLVRNMNPNPAVGRDYKAYLRFQLPVDFDSANSATLTMTRAVAGIDGSTQKVFGLNDGTGDYWLEADGAGIGTVGSDPNVVGATWNNAPGNVTTSASGFMNSSEIGEIVTLSQSAGGANGDSYSTSIASSFLDADTNGLVTFMIGREQVSSSYDHWASSEHATTAWRPTLSLDYTAVDFAVSASQRWNDFRVSRAGVMPTAAWSYFVRYDGSVAEYQTYANAGLNMAMAPRNQVANADSVNGLGIVLGQFENLHQNSVLLHQTVEQSESSGGQVVAYQLEDEPEPDQFAILANAHQYIYRNDQSNALPMVNLLPNYAWLPGSSRAITYGIDYAGYVQKFIDDVHPAVLIHTHYPTLANGTDRADYYSNLELFRTKGLANDIGVMGFVLVTEHTSGPYREPSGSDVRWQANSQLAYGAKGLFYYNYRIAHEGAFSEAIVTHATGAPTVQYAKVQATNSQTQVIAPELLQLTSTGVFHTPKGGSVPSDTTQYTSLVDAPINDFFGDDFLIGVFENQDVVGSDDFIYLVNKRHESNFDISPAIRATASFTLDSMFDSVSYYDPLTGLEGPLLSTGLFGGSDLFEYELQGGAGVLLRFSVSDADFDADGDVTGNDFFAWQRGFGNTSGAAPDDGDANGDGAVNGADLAV